nr:hypothetical protein [Streptomyces sp. CBMA123]
MSDVFYEGQGKPPRDIIYCVRKTYNGHTYVRQAEIGPEYLWNDRGSGSTGKDIALWPIVPPRVTSSDTDERLVVPVGGFTYVAHYDRPTPTPVCWVLDLPAEVKKAPGPAVPVMTSPARPVSTQQVIDYEVTVPHTMVTDKDRNAAWQFANSPFYKLRRKHNFAMIHHLNNTTDTEQEWGEDRTTGVSKSRSEAFQITTGVSVTTGGGINLGVISGSTAVSVSIELGYESRQEVSSFEEVTKRHLLRVPPHKAGALWFAHHELESVRADGGIVAAEEAMAFDLNSTYVTQYPPSGSRVTHLVEAADTEADAADRMARTAPPDDTPAELHAKAAPEQRTADDQA